MNLLTCINTCSTIPLGTFTDLSASKRVTEVGIYLQKFHCTSIPPFAYF